ncbi:MAG: hypothetical protein A3H96_03425 [Acidobacteria bacterium RIFCSPLOWO2_02_FULL_67_36]|nr:MAG: hypothetical protein A3H96_03425 [Acidobacteria bacterium RIFCSPLOWO2_02_FULL_67_36]OFW22763.1 MAG: hypothetical protein A3G21_26110 [Acidobacteria bacterium RIFCSPLOWO2_12_FULL_66_21]
MTAEPSLDRDAQQAWQQQPSEALRTSVEDLRLQTRRFERQIAWRNRREYAAAALAAALLARLFWHEPDTFVRIGAALTIAGMIYIVWQLHARGASRQPSVELGMAPGLEFLKRDLARQRDLLSGVWRWYLAPPLPGIAIVFIATVRAHPAGSGRAWPVAVAAAAIAAIFVVVWRLNVRAASGLQARIDELERPTR